MSGMEDVVIAGGTEMMSYTGSIKDPNVMPTLDGENIDLRDIHPQSNQGVCADAIATLEGIDRETLDQLAVTCLLYTSPSPRDKRQSRMPSSA